VFGVSIVAFEGQVMSPTTTDDSGAFLIKFVGKRPFRITVVASGEPPFTSAIFPAGTQDAGTLLIPVGGRIAGTVTGFDGAPAPNVPLVAAAATGESRVVRTDDEGIYGFAATTGVWRVTPGNPYASSRFSSAIRGSGDIAAAVAVDAIVAVGAETRVNFDFRQLGAGLLAVVRIDGDPKAGLHALLEPGGFEAATDDLGGVGFAPVRPGTYTVRIAAKPELPPLAEETVVLRHGVLETLWLDIRTPAVVVHVDAAPGVDASDARVVLYAIDPAGTPSQATAAFGDGTKGVRLYGVAPGTYRAFVACAGGAMLGAPFVLADEAPRDERISVPPHCRVALRLLDENGGTPPALVIAYRDGIEVGRAIRPDAAGDAVITLELPPGRCTLHAHDRSVEVGAVAGTTVPATLVVPAGSG
jgi:hypothetical protein